MDNPDYDVSDLEAQAEDEGARHPPRVVRRLPQGRERIVALRSELHEAMEEGAGIYRDEDSLQAACETVADLRERYRNVALDDRTNSFNTELTAALELGSLLDVAEAMAHSAIRRTESRGSHQRLDHAERNDDDFLAHSLAYRQPDGSPPRIEYGPVTITKWPPGARTYGAGSGLKKKPTGQAT